MENFKSRKFYATALAAVLAVTAVPRIELGTMQLAGAVQSVLDFQQQLAAMKTPETNTVPFVSLRYDAEKDMLYRDGQPVGDRLGEYAVVNGNVMVSAKAAGIGGADAEYVSLEQAAKQIGCTITEDQNGITVTSPFDSACLIVRGEGVKKQYGAIDCVENRDGVRVLQYATPADAYRAYQQFVNDERVDFAEPSKTVSIADADQTAYHYTTDDNTDWGVSAIGAESYNQSLIASHETLPEVVVAVLDTGIYFAHERFEGRIAGQGAAFLDTDAYTVDDQNGHGSHCAGIIVGATADNVKILPVRILDAEGYGNDLGIYCGMLYAMEQGVDVVSMSLGGSGESALMEYMVDQLYDADIVCCVAAGNESMDADNVHPARAERAITVGAVDQYKNLASFSNYGAVVDVVAPGVDIYSAGIDSPDEFVYMSGTSMATPYVAACAAMVLSADENLSVEDVDAFLKANAIDLGASGKDDTFGYGMVYMGDFIFDGTYCAAPEIIYSDTADVLDMVEVTISCATEGAVIYYTLDGSTPDKENGTLYTETFTLSESAMVKAVSYLGDKVGGYSEAGICINGEDIPDAVVVVDGVLVAYNGVLETLDLSARTDITAIGESAFAGNATITSVYFADTVTSIGDYAFASCPSLYCVEAMAVTAVGKAAFRGSEIWRLNTASLETIGEAAFEECKMLMNLTLSDAITEIPARAMKYCYSLESVSIPNVTVIGDEAFANCYTTEFSDVNWGGITTVGKEAFYGCFLDGVYADFEVLQSIGEGAFCECSSLAGITLPETITVLPANLLTYVNALKYLKAPGVTVVEDSALALHSDSSVETVLDLPFAQITTVGDSAFECFYFPKSVEFSALIEMGDNAFASTSGGMLSFPALKEIPENGFMGAQNPVLYFEQVTTIGRYAFQIADSITVLSEKCTAIDDTAFTSSIIAAPAQSAAAVFARNHDISYCETPSVYAPKYDYTFNALDETIIEGYGLGFGLQYQWYDGNGKAITGATNYAYQPDVQPGKTENFTLRVTDADGNAIGSMDYTVTVRPVEITAELTADTVILSDYDALVDEWDAAAADMGYDYNFSAYRYYSFTPKADGTYYFHLSDRYEYGSTISLYGMELAQEQYDTTKYLEADLTAGETYTFVIHYTDYSSFASALGVSTTDPTDDYNMDGAYWMDAENEIIPESFPYVPELELFNPNFGSNGLVMTEGDDLLILMTGNDAPGQMVVYAFGQGRFIGAATELYITLMQPVVEDEPITVLPTSNALLMQFVPEYDGTYSILTAYALDYLADCSDAEILNDVFNADPYLYIEGDDVYDFVDDYETSETYSRLAALTVDLTAGTKYTISVSAYGDAPFELYITREKKNLLDCEMLCEGWNDTATIIINDANGDAMTEGKDYTLLTLANDASVYTVAKGMGDYYGTLYVYSGDHTSAPATYVDIEVGVPFPYDPESTSYHVTVDAFSSLQLRVADDDYAMFDVYTLNDDGTWTSYAFYLTNLDVITLDAGEYIIDLSPSDCFITEELTLVSVLDISEASYVMENMIYTGETLYAQPAIYYDGELLVEGVDYQLEGASSAEKCGSYSLDVCGIGRFGGVLSISYNVIPNPADATQSLYDGENEIVLDEAGSTNIYQWIPEKSGEYGIASLDIYDVALCVMDSNGDTLAATKGYYEVYGFVDVTAGETYYVTTAFSAADMTGSFTLLLEHGKRDFLECMPDSDDVCYTNGDAVEPKFEMTYYGEKLTEGIDYTIVTYAANDHAGYGVIVMKGMGKYIGTAEYYFDIYLENLNVEERTEEIIEAEIDEEYSYTPYDLDDTMLLQFTNTTSDTDVFSIELTDTTAGVLQAYDATGAPILDFDYTGFVLPEGETIYIYLVTNRTYWYEEISTYLSIHCATEPFVVEHNDVYYLVDPNGDAQLLAVADDRFTYEIEDSFTYNSKQINVVGCAENIWEYLAWNQQVFYVSSVEEGIGLALLDNGFVAVCLDNTSTVEGDADGNGYLDLNDLILFNGYVCETAVIAEENLANCDLNHDGAIDFNDLGMFFSNFFG